MIPKGSRDLCVWPRIANAFIHPKQYLSKNIGQGKISIDQAVKLIKEKYKDDYYEGSDVSMLSMEMGVVAYCNYLIDSGDAAGTNAFLKDIYDSLSWNDKIASYYKSVVK